MHTKNYFTYHIITFNYKYLKNIYSIINFKEYSLSIYIILKLIQIRKKNIIIVNFYKQ